MEFGYYKGLAFTLCECWMVILPKLEVQSTVDKKGDWQTLTAFRVIIYRGSVN